MGKAHFDIRGVSELFVHLATSKVVGRGGADLGDCSIEKALLPPPALPIDKSLFTRCDEVEANKVAVATVAKADLNALSVSNYAAHAGPQGMAV